MRTLYVDIETAPNVAHVWGLWQQNVSLNQLMESGRTICVAAMWSGQEVQFFSEFKHGREAMLEATHFLLSEADAVVHFNGRRFDIPTLNKEFILSGMLPPSPFQTIDLLEQVKRRFRFPSNKLAYVSEALGLSGKESNSGHTMWVKCLAGDKAAWAEMEKYNKQDVIVLEELHRKLLPWITNHPNLRLFEAPDGCPNCGSEDLVKEGFAYTQLGKYQRFSCKGCGGWFKGSARIEGTNIRGAVA